MSEFEPPTKSSRGHLVVGIGELLLDCFGDRKELGGAPANVAFHAHQLLSTVGGLGVPISRIGDDEDGRVVLDVLQANDLSAEHVQTDRLAPTGRVEVMMTDAGEPDYVIKKGSAWDRLEMTKPMALLATRCSAVCYGTLGRRSELSCQTIHQFLGAATHAIRVYDPNLRRDSWSDAVIESGLSFASVLKIGLDELPHVARAAGLDPADGCDRLCRALYRDWRLDAVALTRGPRGTVLYMDGRRWDAAPTLSRPVPGANPVGAGDASTAALVSGLVLGFSPSRILEWMNRVGAFVASHPGATPTLTSALKQFAVAPSDTDPAKTQPASAKVKAKQI